MEKNMVPTLKILLMAPSRKSLESLPSDLDDIFDLLQNQKDYEFVETVKDKDIFGKYVRRTVLISDTFAAKVYVETDDSNSFVFRVHNFDVDYKIKNYKQLADLVYLLQFLNSKKTDEKEG